jgi:hypothetical protein
VPAFADSSDRWGGGVLCLGSIAYAASVLSFMVVYGQPESAAAGGVPTLGDRVAHYQANQDAAHAMWLLETVAVLSLAVAGFVLMGRVAPSAGWAPRRFAWATVGAGAVFLALMYPIMLGGYPAAVETDASLGHFAVVNSIAQSIFQIGNCVIFIGLAAAFASEGPPHGVLSRPVAIAGQIAFLLALVAGIAMIVGIQFLQAVAPIGLLAFLLASYLGWVIARRPTSDLRRR